MTTTNSNVQARLKPVFTNYEMLENKIKKDRFFGYECS